jgi:hypothetical protein
LHFIAYFSLCNHSKFVAVGFIFDIDLTLDVILGMIFSLCLFDFAIDNLSIIANLYFLHNFYLLIFTSYHVLNIQLYYYLFFIVDHLLFASIFDHNFADTLYFVVKLMTNFGFICYYS